MFLSLFSVDETGRYTDYFAELGKYAGSVGKYVLCIRFGRVAVGHSLL